MSDQPRPQHLSPFPHLGNLHPALQMHADAQQRELAFARAGKDDPDRWRAAGRAKLDELLAYAPAPVERAAETLETVACEGYARHRLRYALAPGRATEAFLLVPEGLTGPAPAVLGLHDHGGFYYFGKEKIVELADPPEPLRAHQQKAYEGRPWASALARRGFVVLVPDAFYFGAQRLDPAAMPERFRTFDFTGMLAGLEPGSDDYIRAFNVPFSHQFEELTARTIFAAGATWPGIMAHDDRRALDLLAARPEVDPARLGCMGLSVGGFRAALLAGLEGRLACSVVAGWMSPWAPLLRDRVFLHTWMLYIPGLSRWLDLPDVASLGAPAPLMVANCLQENLFTVESMQAAEATLRGVYESLGAADRFQCRCDDVPHSLRKPAQEAAFDWLARWLG